MAETRDTIINAIKILILKNGGSYSSYYVGITNDPETRLFEEHRVSRNGVYNYWEAMSADSARVIEKHCIDQLGTKGGTGGGDEYSKYVYVYEITSYTDEKT